MFFESGYRGVSVRDLAKVVGIKASSVYSHYESKEDILKSIYEYYNEQRRLAAPDINELLDLAESAPLVEILGKLDYRLPPEAIDAMDKIITIAAREIGIDPISDQFIEDNIFHSTRRQIKQLFDKMIALGRIEPMDTDALSNLISYYCFGTAALNASRFKIDLSIWEKGLAFIFSSIKGID
ncbi:hypothetical protein AGMMS50284_6950 [Clostridia bacterium]|nr:hypothetical protein AGMMS50284_6950 [Clostridia bacterium]